MCVCMYAMQCRQGAFTKTCSAHKELIRPPHGRRISAPCPWCFGSRIKTLPRDPPDAHTRAGDKHHPLRCGAGCNTVKRVPCACGERVCHECTQRAHSRKCGCRGCQTHACIAPSGHGSDRCYGMSNASAATRRSGRCTTWLAQARARTRGVWSSAAARPYQLLLL